MDLLAGIWFRITTRPVRVRGRAAIPAVRLPAAPAVTWPVGEDWPVYQARHSRERRRESTVPLRVPVPPAMLFDNVPQ